MRMLQAFWSIAITASLGGCHQTLLVTTPRSNASANAPEVSWANHFLFGFVGRKQLDLRDNCRQSAVETVELSSNAATVALTVITLGIYCPRRVAVTCASQDTR
jgi:hypothetical protein